MQARRWIHQAFDTATAPAASLLVAVVFLAPHAGALRRADQPLANPSGSKAAAAPDVRQPLKIIASAVAIAESCEPVSQGFLLLLAGDAASQVDRLWAIDYYSKSFEVSRLLPRSGTRLGLQLGLTSRMTGLDPDHALALLEQMDSPDVSANPDRDVRSGVASPIVAGLLREGVDGAEKAASLLNYLGDTGQYPYAAGAQVIDFFYSHAENWRANGVFFDALNHFLNDDRFDDSPDEFVALAQAARDKIESGTLVDAVRSIMSLAQQQETSENQGQEQAGPANAGAYNMPHQARLSRSLGRLLLVVSIVDPSTADELKNEYAALRSIEPVRSSRTSSSGLGHGAGTPGGAQKQVAVQKQDQPAVTGPSSASNESSSLANRSLDLARRAKLLARRDPGAASSLLRQAEALALAAGSASSDLQVDQRQSVDLKVEALAETAEGWAALGDERQASRNLTTAFAAVLDLLERQAAVESATPSGIDSQASLLGRLARLEADLNPQEAERRATRIPDLRLRAYALLSVALEIIQARSSTASVGIGHMEN